MAFTPPPTPPNSGDPANFNARADAFLGWFPSFVAEMNNAGYPDLPSRARLNGTAADPVWTWDGDPDTGLFRAGANTLGFTTGGIERMRLTATGLLTGNVVTQSATDTTTGRLVKVGDFGLGVSISLTASDNLDSIVTTGVYFNSTGANTPGNNYPVASAGSLSVIHRGLSNITQTYITYPGSPATAQNTRMFIRSKGADIWAPWLEVFHQATIIGQVSQSGGLPTGRVIERGSNANGEYVKFADGTMICTRQINLGSVLAEGAGTTANPYRTAPVTATFPAAFIAPPRISLTFPVTGSLSVPDRILVPAGFDALATGITSLRVARVAGTNAASDILCDITAIGRWF